MAWAASSLGLRGEFAGNGRESGERSSSSSSRVERTGGDAGTGAGCCVLARVASDYSKTLLARFGGWLPPFFSSVFLVFYSFGGGFAYARGLEFPTRIGVCWWRFSFLFCFSLSGVGLLEKVFYFASIEKLCAEIKHARDLFTR
jgi:hypothetical protein